MSIVLFGYTMAMDYLKKMNEISLPSNFETVDPETKIKQVDSWWDIIKYAIVAFIIIVPIRLYVVQPFIVSGESMIPTFHDGDYLVIDEISYRLNGPQRGDVIVFHPPNQKKGVYYIKRIIGLPGETVTMTNGKVHISSDTDPKGMDLVEPYLQNMLADNFTTHIGQNEVFVLGDNRPRSSDSRAWGTLPIDNITGRALVRLFPFRDIKYLSVKNQTYGDTTAVASQ